VSRAALAALLAVLAVAPAAAQTRRDDPIQAEQRKLQQTQKQLREERERAAAARARETSLLAELEEIERRLAGKQRDAARLEARIKQAQNDVTMFRGEISRLERHRAGQINALAKRLRAMYRVHAQGGALPVILSGDDPVTRAIAVRHLASLAALDARLIQEYRVTRTGWRTAKAKKRRNSRSWRASTKTPSGSRRRSTARSRSDA